MVLQQDQFAGTSSINLLQLIGWRSTDTPMHLPWLLVGCGKTSGPASRWRLFIHVPNRWLVEGYTPAGPPDFRKWESYRTMSLICGFSRDLPFSPPLYSGAAPFLPHFTLIGSQYRGVKSRPNLSIQLRYDGNTSRFVGRSDEALGVRVSVARIAPSLLHLGRAVASALASHQGDPGLIPGKFAPEFSHAGIVLDDAACRRAFSGYSRFPRPCIPAPLHPRVSFHVTFRNDEHILVPDGATRRLVSELAVGQKRLPPLPPSRVTQLELTCAHPRLPRPLATSTEERNRGDQHHDKSREVTDRSRRHDNFLWKGLWRRGAGITVANDRPRSLRVKQRVSCTSRPHERQNDLARKCQDFALVTAYELRNFVDQQSLQS
ncbi:hypothetical protein PR048_006237 [Dryococelus australis]|uniref:Uncharacterized protein n=1 Tax=Dryococelus australis TaxID=614101 RepID=A0ABQ9IAF4_9NEOP|nr:hypothetical protein PR048_006237 [Dryococelus australis]